MANTTCKKIKDAAIIGGCASLIYLTIGDISYRLSLSRGGLNSKLITDMVAKSAAKKPKNEYKEKLDSMIDDGAAWFMHQDTEKIKKTWKNIKIRKKLYSKNSTDSLFMPSLFVLISPVTYTLYAFTATLLHLQIWVFMQKNTMIWVIMSYCRAFADTEIRSRIS